MHITNTSVNRRNDDYVKNLDPGESEVGSKWSLKAFRSYLIKTQRVEWTHIWNQVDPETAQTARFASRFMTLFGKQWFASKTK